MEFTNKMAKRNSRNLDEEEASSLKRSRADKSEFYLNGEKKVPAPYSKMMMEELLNPGSVDPQCREKIGRDEFFKLHHLFNADDLEAGCARQSREEGTSVVPFNAGASHKGAPCSRSELFQLLYAFGQYYLQCYPQKACGFLEYLAYISKYGQTYSVPTLVKLDNSIRRFFIQRPALNWDVTHREIDRFEKDANIYQEKEKRSQSGHTPSKGRGSSAAQGSPQASRSSHCSCSRDSGYRRDGRGDYSQQDYRSTTTDPRENRCKNWNWRVCEDDPRCHREHVCYYCGSTAHKAKDCPKAPYIILPFQRSPPLRLALALYRGPMPPCQFYLLQGAAVAATPHVVLYRVVHMLIFPSCTCHQLSINY